MGTRDARLSRAVQLREQGDAEASCALLRELAGDCPDDPVVSYQAAWSHDNAGREQEACPFYEHALGTPGLPPADRRGALLGLGSTYRVLGRTQDALRVLRQGTEEFPDDPVLKVFAAMAHHSAGHHGRATGMLLDLLADTTADPRITAYARPIRAYAAEFAAQ